MSFSRLMVMGLSFALVSVPLPGHAQQVTSEYGTRADPFHGGKRAHKGIDMAAPYGTPVYATGDGWVERANSWGSYGLIIIMRHPSGHETRFAHLSAIMVEPGQRVRKGQMIGRIGSTGRSTGNHLHYEVRYRGEALDPRKFM